MEERHPLLVTEERRRKERKDGRRRRKMEEGEERWRKKKMEEGEKRWRKERKDGERRRKQKEGEKRWKRAGMNKEGKTNQYRTFITHSHSSHLHFLHNGGDGAEYLWLPSLGHISTVVSQNGIQQRREEVFSHLKGNGQPLCVLYTLQCIILWYAVAVEIWFLPKFSYGDN